MHTFCFLLLVSYFNKIFHAKHFFLSFIYHQPFMKKKDFPFPNLCISRGNLSSSNKTNNELIISNQVWSGQLPKKKANILFFSFIYYPTSFLREKRFPTSQSLRNPTNLCISRINLSSSNKTKNELIISNQVWSGQVPQKNRHGKKGEKKNLSVYPCNM